ncbi:MAG: hypothetical protein MJ198_05500 [Bacteroidales bacterium]|nr:hypothetical protein [Bacteroidales bacterium]
MHFYTEHTKFGEETGRFSDGGENSFLVTSLFCLSEDAKAFACQKGQIIVVPNAESNALVNVILKPIDNLDIRFRNVAYYVYRGIRKDSILQSDTEMLEPGGTATDLIDRLYSEADFEGAYSADMVGYSNDLTDEVTIDSLFYDMDIKKMFVLDGEWFGTFNSNTSIGFEIVVDTEICPITVGYAKQGRYAVVPSGITDFERRMSREQILAFIDPVAFWGMHSEEGLYVGSQLLKRMELNTAILSCYGNNNRVYIDIRSEYGYSYNVYGIYADSLGNSIQVGTDKNNLTARMYETNGWPIMWLENMDLSHKLYISFSRRGNSEPLIFLSESKQSICSFGTHFVEECIVNSEIVDWTNPIYLKVETQGNEFVIPYVYTMYYFKKNKLNEYYNCAFGYIDKKQIFDDTYKFQEVFYSDLAFLNGNIDGSNFEYIATPGALWDNNRIVLYSKICYPRKTSKITLPQVPQGAKSSGLCLTRESFLQKKISVVEHIITEEGTKVGVLEVIHISILPNKENLLVLGITKEEWNILKQLKGCCEYHHRYIYLQEIFHNEKYWKFELKVSGFNNAGTPIKLTPSNPIYIYSIDLVTFNSIPFSMLEAINNKEKISYIYGIQVLEWSGYIDDYREKNVLKVIENVCILRTELIPSLLCTIALGEGLNLWIERNYSSVEPYNVDITKEIDGYVYLGVDYFFMEYDRYKIYLPHDYRKDIDYTIVEVPNEHGVLLKTPIFKNLRLGIYALAAMLTQRLNKFLNDAKEFKYGSPNEDQLFFWLYVYFQGEGRAKAYLQKNGNLNFMKNIKNVKVGNIIYDMREVRKLSLQRLATWRYLRTKDLLSK